MASMNKTPSEEGTASHTMTSMTALHRTHMLRRNRIYPHTPQTLYQNPQKPAHKPKSKAVADSWDEDASGSDTETEEAHLTTDSSPQDSLDPISTITSNEVTPHPPPPTPASPTPFEFPDNVPYGAPRGRGDSRGGLDKRPEKTTAVAGRLIAGALGVRAPKRTDEEREYDKAMREKERKRRTAEKEREKREQEETEARRKAIWHD